MDLPFIVPLLASGALSSLALGSYLYLRDRARLKRRHARLQRHLKRLQRLSSKLLNACSQLLNGDTPQDSVLYHVFSARGGEHYDDLRAEMAQCLQRSQQALDAAFDLRRKLLDPTVRQSYPLEQQVWHWEMLYAALVGRSERIQQLTPDQVALLLDPLLAFRRQALDIQADGQLEDLRRELTDMPLRVQWQVITANLIESEGLLNQIDHLKTHIAHLTERHRQRAPQRLAQARNSRQVVESEIPPFWHELYRSILSHADPRTLPAGSNAALPPQLAGDQLLIEIDRRLVEMQNALDNDECQTVVEGAAALLRDLETVSAFMQTMSDHGRRQAQIDAIVAQGYRPPQLTQDLCDIKLDVQTIVQHLLEGDYAAAAPWVLELQADSQRALAGAEAWPELCDRNLADLENLTARLNRLTAWWQEEIVPAWRTLQDYPRANWTDLAAGMVQARQTFDALCQTQAREIKSLNGLLLQKFTEAEKMLDYAAADLAQIEAQFQAVVNRLANVQAIESHIAAALRLTEASLSDAQTLREREDVKIGPEVDRQIFQAGRLLAEARRRAQAREFLAALNAQTSARRLATAAYVSADEQVREINTLQIQLETVADNAQRSVAQCLCQARDLPPVVQTASTNRLGQQLQEKLAWADQARAAAANLQDRALAEALRAAAAAYEQVSQQAGWLAQQVTADRQEYEAELNQTLAALSEAEAAIQQAEQAAGSPAADDARQHALRRARLALPPQEATENATREALVRLQRQAQEALRYTARVGKNRPDRS